MACQRVVYDLSSQDKQRISFTYNSSIISPITISNAFNIWKLYERNISNYRQSSEAELNVLTKFLEDKLPQKASFLVSFFLRVPSRKYQFGLGILIHALA